MMSNIHIAQAFDNALTAAFNPDERTFLHNSEYFVRIDVTGIGCFPFDQLRRYRLVPTDAGDNMDSNVGGSKTVSLEFADASITNHLAEQCALRFASFNWSVSDCTITITKLGVNKGVNQHG
jgi:hypothetical protein